jgi:putative DNA primase/helicase
MEMVEFLKPDGPEKSGRLMLGNFADKKTGASYRGIRMQWKSNLVPAPTLHIDASARMEHVMEFLPQANLRADIQAEAPHQRVTQYYSHTFSDKALMNKKLVADIWTHCVAKAIQLDGRHLVICQKRVEEVIRASFDIPPFIELAHFGALEGIDTWGYVRALFQIGRQQAPPDAMERMAGALTGRAVDPIQGDDGWYPTRTQAIHAKDGGKITLDVDTHPDAMAESCRASICNDGQTQGVGRGRGLNRTAETPLDIFAFTDIPLDVPVDHLSVWERPSIDDKMMAKGVWLESAADAAAAFPDLGSRNAIRKARKRSTRPFSYRGTNRKVAACSRMVDYTGSDGRKRQALFDVRMVPEPEMWLTERLGVMKFVKPDETPAPAPEKIKMLIEVHFDGSQPAEPFIIVPPGVPLEITFDGPGAYIVKPAAPPPLRRQTGLRTILWIRWTCR